MLSLKLGLSFCALAVATAQSAAELRRMINGGSVISQATMDSTYPWFASMVSFDASDGSCGTFCGGAMISQGTFLTAAHCVADGATSNIANIVLVVGYAGTYPDMNTLDESIDCDRTYLKTHIAKTAPNAKMLELKEFVKPKHYNKISGYDIALVFIKQADCSERQGGASVMMSGQCGKQDYEQPLDSKLATLLGFGATKGEQGAHSLDLKKLDSKFQYIGQTDYSCNLAGPNALSQVPYSSFGCLKETGATGSCVDAQGQPLEDLSGCNPGVKGAGGDSGGPWVVPDGNSWVHILVQSSGARDSDNVPFGWGVRDAWFQDFILDAVKAKDVCAGGSVSASSMFKGYAVSADQFCQSGKCSDCWDDSMTPSDCLSTPSCAIDPAIADCVSMPKALTAPTCNVATSTTTATGTTPGATTTATGATPGATTTATGATLGATTTATGATLGATTTATGATPGATTTNTTVAGTTAATQTASHGARLQGCVAALTLPTLMTLNIFF